MRLDRKSILKCILFLIAVQALAVLAAVPSFAQTSTPAVVSSSGYINGTALTTHATAAFNSSGATTLVAFVSTNSPWNGLPVSINNLSDNVGNTWTELTGPTLWVGQSFPLLSAIYYVNAPVSSATHMLTVSLSNPAPLVVHVFAVSGSDVSGPPINSAITDPGAGVTSAVVTTAPISVPSDTLLLSWVKNETGASATALDGYNLDPQSTSFLWAESQTALSAGSYTGDFQYSAAIGWQTAIVGLKPQTGPVAFSQVVNTRADTPVSITLKATSPQGLPLIYTVLTTPTNGVLSGVAPNLTYTPNSGYLGGDTFTFKANDGTTDSNVATVRVTVQGPAVVSSSGYMNSTALTAHTTAAFNSSGATTLVAFVSSHSLWNGLPVSINNLNDNVGNTWTELTGPTLWVGQSFPLLSAIYYVNAPVSSATHMLTVSLSNPAPLVVHVFAVSGSDVWGPPINSAITDPGAGVTSAVVTTAPISVPSDTLLLSWVKNETGASATALDGYNLDPQSTSFLWAESQTALSAGSYTGDFQYSAAIGWQTAVVGLKPPGTTPPPVLTSTPANPANETSASFSFSDTELGVSFLCQLDQSAFSTCLSPTTYSGLTQGSHMFSVKAQGASGNQSAATSYSWTINIPSPTVSSVSPNSGSTAGGTAVTITGTNFAAGATVTFGGTAATNVVVVSGTQITATTPAGSARMR